MVTGSEFVYIAQVAERVAAERTENCGDSVGYQIRFEHELPQPHGSILYCTTGILLKMLESDKLLNRATHIVLDEIHERDLLSDFLMIVLKDILKKRPDLKLILMSATLNAEAFSKYYDNCPMFHIPGFTYPVEEFLLEDVVEMLRYSLPQDRLPRDRPRWGRAKREKMEKMEEQQQYQNWVASLSSDGRYSRHTVNELQLMDPSKVNEDLIYQLIKYIAFNKKEGAILVFMPGWTEISNINKLLKNDAAFNSSKFRIIPLHSLMPTVNQREVFNRPPPGVRKIVLATNIAETSITIDDIVYVIDSGFTKVSGFKAEQNLSTLGSQLVAKANARQRRGRAGRVQAGECYHLYSDHHLSKMEDYIQPEILRTRLEELCLQIKHLKLGKIVPFVSQAMQPPSIAALEQAIQNLQTMNALDKDENLLPLGKHLARMPIDPHSGKMILFGAMFGCLDPILTIVASLNFKDPFVVPLEKMQEAQQAKYELSDGCHSDHILVAKTFLHWEGQKWRENRQRFCWNYFLSGNTLSMISRMREQLADVLLELGFIRSSNNQHVDRNAENEDLVKAIVCAGLYPNIGIITRSGRKKGGVKFMTHDRKKCELHPGSVANDLEYVNGKYVVYHKMMETTKVFIYDCSIVSPYALLLFGGQITEEMENDQYLVCVDDWIKFQSNPETVAVIRELREEIDRILEAKIQHTGETDWGQTSWEGNLFRTIIELVESETST